MGVGEFSILDQYFATLPSAVFAIKTGLKRIFLNIELFLANQIDLSINRKIKFQCKYSLLRKREVAFEGIQLLKLSLKKFVGV